MKQWASPCFITWVILFNVYTGSSSGSYGQTNQKGISMEILTVKSPAFSHMGTIPSQYTCDGENISPPLEWTNVPMNAKSIVLLNDDPDAPIGDWVHWILFNIPPDVIRLKENFILRDNKIPGIKGGMNDSDVMEYRGPCPPSGTHRYFFKIFALDIMLDFKEGITKKELLRAIEGHILARGELIGKYQRKK